jgi:hypothetical protein
MSDIEVSVVLDTPDSDHSSFLLKDEPLVRSSMEAEHNKRTIVHKILGNVKALGSITMDSIDYVILLWFELTVLGESHTLSVTLMDRRSNLMNFLKLILPVIERLLGLLLFVDRIDEPNLFSVSLDLRLNNILFIILSSMNSQS